MDDLMIALSTPPFFLKFSPSQQLFFALSKKFFTNWNFRFSRTTIQKNKTFYWNKAIMAKTDATIIDVTTADALLTVGVTA